MRVDLELGLEISVPEDLDPRVLADESLSGERLRGDLPVGREAGEPAHVDRDEALAKAVLEAAQLRDAHVERRLTTLEPPRQPRPGPRELALRPPARGLALSLRRPAAEPAGGLSRSALRPDLVMSHLASFTATRCATRRSIPRTVGESSCETVCPVRRRPSAPSVRRAPSFSPMALRACVISRSGTRRTCFFASSTPFLIASGTSSAFPSPAPTWPRPSPTTTIAEKLNRRPPLTTLDTRLICTTRSVNSRRFASILAISSISGSAGDTPRAG